MRRRGGIEKERERERLPMQLRKCKFQKKNDVSQKK